MRLLLFRAAVLATFLVLAGRLWQLQIVRRQEFLQRADRNRFHVEAVPAPRGVIYDRDRRLLVQNLPRYNVSIVASRLPEEGEARQAVLERLSSILGIPVSSRVSPPLASARGVEGVSLVEPAADLVGLVEEASKRPLEPYPVATNVDRQLAFVLIVQSAHLPGVVVEIEATRQYLDGPLLSHIVGYMWRMPKEEVGRYLSSPDSDYTANDMVGYSGLERAMESELRGRRGARIVEADAFGREVSVLATEPPVPGHSLVLTLDHDLQAHTEQYLRQGMMAVKSPSAVAIVMSPRTGEVLAMVSLPSYDNNLFSQGKIESFADLRQDPSLPLFHRAIAGQYPPGSTFKIIPASAALQEKIISRSTTFKCEGTMYLEAADRWPFYCWIRKYNMGHGDLNIVGGLAQSCDIFFYQLAGGYGDFAGLGLERLSRYAQMFGIGQPTGIELPGEAAGLAPSSRWKQQTYKEVWTTGDTYNAAIGQGYVLATPLQMVNALCAVANGGTLYRPQVIREIIDANGRIVRPFRPEVIRRVDVAPAALAIVREGLRLAVSAGTARLADLPGLEVSGKTGSAEFGVPDAKGDRPTHAWFMAFAPYENPEVAVIVFVEGGGEGSGVAAPIVAQILRYYYGLPVVVDAAAAQ